MGIVKSTLSKTRMFGSLVIIGRSHELEITILFSMEIRSTQPSL
jgi:hypothetical protein